MNNIETLSLAELARRLKSRDVSPVDAVEACLTRIEATEDRLNAYACVLADDARAAAKQAEQEIATGQYRGPLHGVPVAIKDLCDLAGTATTASSRVRQSWQRDVDGATAADLKAAGAIIVGKTHLHEFAYGITTPTTRNQSLGH